MIFRLPLPQLSLKWIALLLGVVGIVLLGASVIGATQRIEKLRSWPRVEAHVEGGDVASLVRRGRREAMYAAKLDLSYDFGGRLYTVPVTEEVYSSNYAAQARAVDEATRDLRVRVLLDPDRPNAPVLNAGYNPEFFFSSLVFAWIGGILVFLAVVFRRVFEDEAPATKNKKKSGGAKWIAAFFAILGAGFVGGGITLFSFAQRQLSTWRPVAARIDSTDVVWQSSRSRGSGSATSGSTPIDLYAARAWITYGFRGSTYHVPVIRGAYSNDSSGAAGTAAMLLSSGNMSARIDPANPLDAAVERPGAVSRFWLPALFIVPGLVCLYLAWVFGRTKKKRQSRRRASVAA